MLISGEKGQTPRKKNFFVKSTKENFTDYLTGGSHEPPAEGTT